MERVLFAPLTFPPLRGDVTRDLLRYREWVTSREKSRLNGLISSEYGLANAQRVAVFGDSTCNDSNLTKTPTGPTLDIFTTWGAPDPLVRLTDSLTSVLNQTKSEWNLWIASSSTAPLEIAETLDSDTRIHLIEVASGTNIIDSLSRLYEASTGEAVLYLGLGDLLVPDAVSLLSTSLIKIDAVYADEDYFTPSGTGLSGTGLSGTGLSGTGISGVGLSSQLYNPCLKPNFSPELLLASPYIGRPLAIRRETMEHFGGITKLSGHDWEHDLMLRLSETRCQIGHISEVLCHRFASLSQPDNMSSKSDSNGQTETSGEAIDFANLRIPDGGVDGASGGLDPRISATAKALARENENSELLNEVRYGPFPYAYSIIRRPSNSASVSIVIPFRDGAKFLRTCFDSIVSTTNDVERDVILMDNGSSEPETQSLIEILGQRLDVTVIRDSRDFNWSALNNTAADAAKGDILLFLNNDTKALHEGWLGQLCAQALRIDVAAVGPRLLYPDRRLQHAGVVIGMGGAAGHVLVGLEERESGYLGMARLPRECSGVTGACMAIEKELFTDLGGFDETLAIDLSDIDLCLRAREHGYRNLYDPVAEVIHYESPSRGTSANISDIRCFVDRWEHLIELGDPYLNIHLTRMDCSCALRGLDEEGWWQKWRSTLSSL